MKKYIAFPIILFAILIGVSYYAIGFIRNYISEFGQNFPSLQEPVSNPVFSGDFEYKINDSIKIQIGTLNVSLYSTNNLLTAKQVLENNNLDIQLMQFYYLLTVEC